YITVDYIDSVQVQAAGYDDQGNFPSNNKPAQRRAFGRMQPYAANAGFQQAQAPNPAYTNQPQHTVFRHNSTTAATPPGPVAPLMQPFSWLVHLDRQLTSPMELLQVSGFKPH